MEAFFQNEHRGDKILPVKISITNLENGLFISPHWHEFLEILYFFEGKCTVQINNSYFEVSSGDMVIINNLDIHSISGCSRYFVLEFEKDLTKDLSIPLLNIFPKEDDRKYISGTKENSPFAASIKMHMEEILVCYTNRPAGYELDIRGSIYKILAFLIRHSTESGFNISEYNKTRLDLTKLEKLLEYIEKNYDKEISTPRASVILNLEMSYFCRFFKRIMGKTFLEYLTYYRCNKAEELLYSTSLTVTEIAIKVGFNSSNYLAEQFKRYKGVTPSAARKIFLKV